MSESARTQPVCELCGEPMPPGEEMFKFHGYSGTCPVQSSLEKRQDRETLSAIDALFDAYNRLKLAGWNDAMHCPKDGTVFEVIEAGSTGIHDCHYAGEWPSGVYWVHSPNDLWPSRPILFRLKRKAKP